MSQATAIVEPRKQLLGARPPSKGVGWNSRWAKNHERQELKASGVSRRISASLRDYPRRLGSSASATLWTFPVWVFFFFFVCLFSGRVRREHFPAAPLRVEMFNWMQ